MPTSVWFILSKWEGLNDVKLWLPRSLWSTGTKMAEWKFKHCVICPPAQSGGPLQLYRCLSLFYWWTVTRPVSPHLWLEGPGANTAPGARNWSKDRAVFPGPTQETKDKLAGWSALQTWRLLSGSKKEGAEREQNPSLRWLCFWSFPNPVPVLLSCPFALSPLQDSSSNCPHSLQGPLWTMASP